MHGNVAEWTESYHQGPAGRGILNCDSRVMLSGAFATFAWFTSVSMFGGKALHRRGTCGIGLVQFLESQIDSLRPSQDSLSVDEILCSQESI